MEKKILLFGFSRSAHADLIGALRARGFKIVATTSLSRLHMILPGRHFEAILVPEEVLERHGMAPSRHLWKARSPRVIVSVGQCRPASGNAPAGRDYAIHRGPARTPRGETSRPEGSPMAEGLIEIIAALAESGRRGSAQRDAECVAECENAALYGEKPFPEGIDPALFHRKMREALIAIASSGDRGIPGSELQRRLWPKGWRERRKDVQIYVSKIRKRLDSAEPNRFSIRFDGERYSLRDARRP